MSGLGSTTMAILNWELRYSGVVAVVSVLYRITQCGFGQAFSFRNVADTATSVPKGTYVVGAVCSGTDDSVRNLSPSRGESLKTATALTLLIVVLICARSAHADTFGSDANMFEIEFVPIGNPGNLPDTTGDPNPAGAVPYRYRMGKYEVSEDMINKANAEGNLGITHVKRGANKPVTNVTWFEAATFVNWLNTSTGHLPAYKFIGGTFELWQPSDPGYNPDNRFRNSHAFYVLPSADEWYKAAYYDPIAGVYYDYPTGSNNVPDGIDGAGDPTFDAVFFDYALSAQPNAQPNDITNVGVLSPYGTAGQGGNVWEREETEFDLVNDSIATDPRTPLAARGERGGDWSGDSFALLSSSRFFSRPDSVSQYIGFRVASIPEPDAVLLAVLAVAGLLPRRAITRRPIRHHIELED